MKTALIFAGVACMAFVALAGDEQADQAGIVDSRYELPYAWGEHLSLLLRLSRIPDTKVTTESKGINAVLIVSAPQRVHDGIAPFVKMLNDEQEAKHAKGLENLRKHRVKGSLREYEKSITKP